MLKINKESLKDYIEDIWYHLLLNGRSTVEYRLYYNVEDGELFFASNVGSNWELRGDKLVCISTVSQNVDLHEWFDLPSLYDDNDNNIGVWWDDDPDSFPFTEDDFFTEIFKDYIQGIFAFENAEYYDYEKGKSILVVDMITDEEYNNLDDTIYDILSELREELNINNEDPILT